MFKKLLFAVATLATTISFAQESYDFTTIVLADNSTRYTAAQATLTDEGAGFRLTPNGTKNFFELRINNTTCTDQNRVTINLANNTTTADSMIFKSGATTLSTDVNEVSFSATQIIYTIGDPAFTGDIQLRSRFFSSAGVMADTTSLDVVSLIVDFAILSTSVVDKNNIYAEVSAYNGTISAKGANIDAVYSITGQEVGTTGLASGIYIVKISNGSAVDTVKVIMD